MTLWSDQERAEQRPFDFAQAKAADIRAHDDQTKTENDVRTKARELAEAERTYRKALAAEMLTLHAKGKAITACYDLARGDERIANLRYLRDVAEGAYEAAKQACYKVSADRRELEQLVDWSQRVAPDGQERERGPRAA